MITFSPLLGTIAIGGFNGVAALFGLLSLIQVTQFIYYGFDKNDPSES